MGVRSWIIFPTLLASLIASHFVAQIWRGILQHPTSVQRALEADSCAVGWTPHNMRWRIHAHGTHWSRPCVTPLKNSSFDPHGDLPPFDPENPRAWSASTLRYSL